MTDEPVDLDLYRCPLCGTPTTPSSAGHPSLCERCTLDEVNTRRASKEATA